MTRHHRTQNPLGVPRRLGADRRGFTLVELLVVIGILILLTVMTLSLVNVTQNEDRVRAGAAQVQSYLEGARDRAIHAGEPRGVRFLPDSVNPNVSTSLIYIGPPEEYGEGKLLDVREHVNQTTGEIKYEVRPNSPTDRAFWRSLYNRNLLADGSPIQIDGQFYTIVSDNNNTATVNDDFFRLTKKFSGSNPIGLEYRLFLNPTILPNQEPRQLPRGVVVDLAHEVPAGSGTFVSVSQTPDAWGSPGSYNNLDVLFSPNGTVTGLVASAGVIHLVVADQVDVDQLRLPGASTKEGNERIVSVRTQTGNISVHHVDPTDADLNSVVDDPFRYAARGEVAK